MIPITILLEESTAEFYARVAAMAGRSVDAVLSDSLFKLAGELSLRALHRADKKAAENHGLAIDNPLEDAIIKQ